jgi:iron complex transport system ATP-binding protein
MTRLVAERLSIRIGGRRIVDGVDLSADAGEFIGLIGPNGAGKSTLLRALAGLIRPASGRVLLNGAHVLELDPRELARRRAYLPQQRELAWSYSVEAVVALGRFAYGAPRRLEGADRAAVDRALAAVGLHGFKDRDAFTLSGGETARMHLARALAAEAPLLFADEPTSSLDIRHQIEIMRIMSEAAEAGGLVLAAIHDLALAARFCSRLIVVDRGRIVADGLPDGTLSAERLASVFAVEEDGRSYRLSP